jgi:hypothetical protein
MSLRHAAHVLSRPLPQGLATLMYREHDKWHGKN